MNGTAKEPLRCVMISFSFDLICWHPILMNSEPNSATFNFLPNCSGQCRFRARIKTSKVDTKWFDLIGNQDCNRTKGTSFIAIEPHFGHNPDCSDYERNAMISVKVFKEIK